MLNGLTADQLPQPRSSHSPRGWHRPRVSRPSHRIVQALVRGRSADFCLKKQIDGGIVGCAAASLAGWDLLHRAADDDTRNVDRVAHFLILTRSLKSLPFHAWLQPGRRPEEPNEELVA